MYCGEAIAVKNETVAKTAVSLKCRSWHCENCAPRRKKQLIAEAMGGAPCTFLTLTYRARPTETPDQGAVKLTRAWRLVRKRLMRKYHWRKLPFLAVMEKTENGWPHLHILLRARFIPQALLSRWMDQICSSPVVWIEKISNKKRAAGYCAKYCGKAAQKFETTKRYWQSQDYDLRPPPEDLDEHSGEYPWERFTIPLWRWVANMQDLGLFIVWEKSDKAYCYSPRGDPFHSG